MRILGIDPGLQTVGIGLVEIASNREITVLDWLTIETETGTEFADRLYEIERDLNTYIEEMEPLLCVVEKLYFSVNVKTALDVAQARGVILATLAKHHIPLLEVTPPALKSCITGDGRADKKQVQTMLKTMFQLEEVPTPDDAADALALAVFGALQKNAVVV